jgi:hypothetical protein
LEARTDTDLPIGSGATHEIGHYALVPPERSTR